MDDYMSAPEDDDNDHGGVHINSGIPNRAFYLTAAALGGHAWERAGQIWYRALMSAKPTTQFADFAGLTETAAAALFGSTSAERSTVTEAWRQVGIGGEQRGTR
jgi:Zn-dependent metalloprotease